MSKSNMPMAPKALNKPNVRFDLPETVLSKYQPNIKASTETENTISIYEQIGYDYWDGSGVTAQRISAALRYIGDEEDVIVNINSPGGDVFEGLAIYNLLRNHKGNVTVRVLGVAASAASVIAMAGDEIQIARAGFIMIHNCWSWVVGNQHDMRDAADYLAVFDESATDIYQARTGLDKKEITKLLDAESWLSGSQAIEKGFADDYLPADQVIETEEEPTQAAIRKVDQILAKQHIPRNERRKLFQAIKAGTHNAVAPKSTPDATPQTTHDAGSSHTFADGSASKLSNALKDILP
ncbi:MULTISPECIES: head maturation protease, ClpP-related [Acinetobacter calcoaceticus/baumannii complex]|nr:MULTISPECIES: head maturation protease, ClpP-related [Acinetobacter calcoaceticus/baumannii complex]MCT9452044.1 Clp protease ClpP [Acinetobacter baumannii]OCY90901.1 peptidase [Acinetobacter pittii]HCA5022571.1 Clp protease ClpP [Acinetobacter baumannii]